MTERIISFLIFALKKMEKSSLTELFKRCFSRNFQKMIIGIGFLSLIRLFYKRHLIFWEKLGAGFAQLTNLS